MVLVRPSVRSPRRHPRRGHASHWFVESLSFHELPSGMARRQRRGALQAALVCVCLLGGCARAAPDKGEIEDYYARLGVPPTASQKQIKQAYHQMSIK